MTDIRNRLVKCFRIVFPDVPETEIPQLTQAATAKWDSVATITLLNVVEDEFRVEMDLDEAAKFSSFDKIQSYLQQQPQAA